MAWIETVLRNVRLALRRLGMEPSFTVGAILTLALGLGASTATFSALNGVLFRPLPYPRSHQVVSLSDRSEDGSRAEVTFGTFLELAERGRTFEALAVYKGWQPILTGPAEPDRVRGQQVSADYFRTLGVAPLMGRSFTPADDRTSSPPQVILSHRAWVRRFGGHPGIVGSRVTLDGAPAWVIGVMPPSFENVVAPDAELWAPLQYELSQPRAWGHHLRLVGRLRVDVGLPEARADLDAITRNPVPEFARPAWASLRQGMLLSPLREEVTRGVRPAFLLIAGAVSLLLFMACVNVTNLLLARALRRESEYALRAALGASRVQLSSDLLVETLTLASLGGAAGLGVAWAGLRMFKALFAGDLPQTSGLVLDGATLGFAFALTTVVGLALGVVPALQAARRDPQAALQSGPRGLVRGRHTLRSALIVSEVALALMLLVGSGLLLRSTRTLLAVPPGFNPSQVLTLQLRPTGSRYQDPGATRRYFAAVLEAVKGVPGVVGSGFTSQLPLSGDLDQYGIRLAPTHPGAQDTTAPGYRYAVSPGYFEAMRIPLRRGRFLEPQDHPDGLRVAVISESMARVRMAGREPLGQSLVIGTGAPYTVVGVVGDVKQQSLALEESDAVYVPEDQWRFSDDTRSLVVRAAGDPTALLPHLRTAIGSVDPGQAILRVAPLESLVAHSASERRFALRVLEVFALAALALAAAGIYGVVASSVVERRKEFGVRSALGASPGMLIRMVLGQGLAVTGLGLLAGLVGAAGASSTLSSLLFGISPLDPATYGGMVALLTLVALASCALPAWRAAQVDPSEVLRTD